MAFDLGNLLGGLLGGGGGGGGQNPFDSLFGGGNQAGGGLNFPVGGNPQQAGLLGQGGLNLPNMAGGQGQNPMSGLSDMPWLSTDKQQGLIGAGGQLLGGLGSLYGNMQKIKMGKDQIAMQKSMYNDNAGNRVKRDNFNAMARYRDTTGSDLSPEGVADFKKRNTMGFNRL